MATLYGYEIIDQTLLNVDFAGRRGSVLVAQYGDDYRDTAYVGIGRSGYRFTLSAGVWPDDDTITEIDTVAAMEYYWEFFNDRIDAGNEPFIIEWRNALWLVDLAEPELGVECHTSDLFTPSGIEVRGRRTTLATFNADGSLYDPPPSVPSGLSGIAESETTVDLDWEAST